MPALKTSTQKAKDSKIVIHHAPEVLALATAASGRLQKLLSLCDRQIDKLHKQPNAEDAASGKEAKALIRLVLSLHKNLDHYSEILHPPLIESIPLADKDNGYSLQTHHETSTTMDIKVPAMEKQAEEKVVAVMGCIVQGSICAEQGVDDLPSKEAVTEMTTDEWEESQLDEIETSRQRILKDIEAGKLTRRQGLEMIGNMEWRFKRELQERQAADQNRKSGNRWAG